MPKTVTKAARVREVSARAEAQTARVLTEAAEHHWGPALGLAVLDGLRRSELLGLRWSDVYLDAPSVTIGRGLVEVRGKSTWTEGKNARSRLTIPLDASMGRALAAHQRAHPEERVAMGPARDP